MAGKTSEYTKAIEQLRAEIRFAREHAMENSKIPVGEEELSKRDARNRFSNMSPEQRQTWIQQNSLDAALDLVRPPQGQQQPEAMPGGELPLSL
jgi:Tfp pilus assembly protein FimT